MKNEDLDKKLNAKYDELHHLDEIHKHTCCLLLTYTSGVLEDSNKVYYTQTSLSNIASEMSRVRSEIDQLSK